MGSKRGVIKSCRSYIIRENFNTFSCAARGDGGAVRDRCEPSIDCDRIVEIAAKKGVFGAMSEGHGKILKVRFVID
ncbi:MAG: hypothetical protein JW891_07090 [Candidatus Lokiarchaeota archaeon]|nr:hypothetical protein [Candidatus Lokiarchaeota archaeon]